jgi:predicted site-specific integrase-resolvase
MSATMTKEYLTLNEAARLLERAYGTVRLWAMSGRIKAETREEKGRTYYRIPLAEAERAKEQLEKGLWV